MTTDNEPIDLVLTDKSIRDDVLRQMMTEVRAVNVLNGWRDNGKPSITFGEEVALIHSEASEMLEAYRDHGLADTTNQDRLAAPNPKPEGVGSEAADILIRLLDFCAEWNVELAWEYDRKLAYNRTRGYRHGGKRL